MSDPEYITVTAPPDRVTPVHKDDGREPGGGQLRVTAEVVVRVRYRGSHTIRRSLKRLDLIACDMNGAPVASAQLAAAPDELPGGRIDRRARAVADAIAHELTLARSAALADALAKKSDLDAVVDLMSKEQT